MEHGEQPGDSGYRQDHRPRRMPVPPTANPVLSIAEFQKNIDSGLPRITVSLSVIASLL
jgi:hypothetical protein